MKTCGELKLCEGFPITLEMPGVDGDCGTTEEILEGSPAASLAVGARDDIAWLTLWAVEFVTAFPSADWSGELAGVAGTALEVRGEAGGAAVGAGEVVGAEDGASEEGDGPAGAVAGAAVGAGPL